MISIVIPTYRRADLLSRLLDSVHAQTFDDYEIIVVDDASPNDEDYIPVIKSAKLRFKNFRYIRLKFNGGAPRARNVGIAQAQGDWLALVDDDDEWLPEKLSLQDAIAKDAPDSVGLIYTWTRAVDGSGKLLYESTPEIEGQAANHIFKTNFIMSPSVMVRRKVFDWVGGFDENLPSCQDWDMWARILGSGFECRVVRLPVTIYHRHGQASVGLSKGAMEGYRLFLQKHWMAIFHHTGPANWIKKLLLFTKTIVAKQQRMSC